MFANVGRLSPCVSARSTWGEGERERESERVRERESELGYRHVEMKLASVCVCLLMRKPECVSRKEGICIALNELEICVRRILSG